MVYSIDPATFRVVQVEYDRCAEQDTNVLTHYRVVYSNYRAFGNSSLPSTVTTYANGVLSSLLDITDFTSGIVNPPSLFDLSGVAK
jgi:hypothetical protein